MASIKLLLRQDKKNEEGVSPLFFRIIKDRKSKFISAGLKIKESEWDDKNQRIKKNHSNSGRANALIAKKKAQIEEELLDMEIEDKSITKNSFLSVQGKNKTDFFSYSVQYLDKLKSNQKVGSYKRVKYTIEKLKVYNKSSSLNFNDITVTYLKNYEQYLADTLDNKVNTIHANFRVIRAIINNAIDEDILKRDKNPFYKFKMKTEPVIKDYLTENEIEKIESLELDESMNLHHHRNMYIFACYVGGLRISDMLQLKWSNFDGTHITVNTQKTGSVVSVKVPNKGLEILEYYKAIYCSQKSNKKEDSSFIFPALKEGFTNLTPDSMHAALSSSTALINKNLKTIAKKAAINKSISFHSSRHTFATRALRKGMRIEYVSKLLAHTNISQTEVYAKIVSQELDKAMDVFND